MRDCGEPGNCAAFVGGVIVRGCRAGETEFGMGLAVEEVVDAVAVGAEDVKEGVGAGSVVRLSPP